MLLRWSTQSFSLFSIFFISISGLYASTAFGETVFASYPLGVVTVGIDDKRREIRRAVTFVVSGNDPASEIGAEQSRTCAVLALPPPAKKGGKGAGASLVRQLEILERRFNPTIAELSDDIQKQLNLVELLKTMPGTSDIRQHVTDRFAAIQLQLATASPQNPEEQAAAAKAEIEATHRAFLDAMNDVSSRLSRCNNNLQLRVGVALVSCYKSTGVCEHPTYALNGSVAARRFARVHDWLKAMNPDKKPFPTNALIRLSPSTQGQTVTLEANEDTFSGVADPSLQIDPIRAQENFERLSKFAREVMAYERSNNKPNIYRIPSVSADAIGLKREVAYRLIDTIADPAAIVTLVSDPQSKLRVLQDEIARTRIKECVFYKGRQGERAISECAAYRLTGTEVLDCLSGNQCIPAIEPKGWAQAALLVEPKGIQDMVKGQLPRLANIQISDKIDQISKACEKTSSKNETVESCVMRLSLPAELQYVKLKECVNRKPSTVAEAANQLSCIPAFNEKLPDSAKRAMDIAKCLDDPAKTDVDCLLAASASSKQVQALLDCSRKTQAERLACGAGVLGASPEMLQAYDCLKSASGDNVRVAACAGRAVLGKDAAKAIACAQKPSDNYYAMAVCVGGDAVLPESVKRPVQCLASSAGNPMGAAVCMAGDGLSEDQRIALQCAAQTGGEPNSFMVCAGGQMLMSTIVQCKDIKFGTGKCFGDGNELQKFVKAVFGKPIKPNSPLGHVINAQIDVIKIQVAAAQFVGKEAGRFLEGAEREFKRAEKNINRALSDAERTLIREPIRVLSDGLNDLLKW